MCEFFYLFFPPCFLLYFAPFRMRISDDIPLDLLPRIIWAYLFWHSAGVLGDESDAYCFSPSNGLRPPSLESRDPT